MHLVCSVCTGLDKDQYSHIAQRWKTESLLLLPTRTYLQHANSAIKISDYGTALTYCSSLVHRRDGRGVGEKVTRDLFLLSLYQYLFRKGQRTFSSSAIWTQTHIADAGYPLSLPPPPEEEKKKRRKGVSYPKEDRYIDVIL